MSGTPMTTGEVSRRLRRGEATIRRWEVEGRLQAVRTESGVRLFDPKSVEQVALELEQGHRAGR